MTAPTIGRVVHYELSNQDAAAIAQERRDNPARRGNAVTSGDVFPATIVRVWSADLVQLQVHLDGNDTYWATSKHEGNEAGTWAWPTRS